MKKLFFITGILVFIALGVYLFSNYTNEKTHKESITSINVMVSILPQVEFIKRIGGDKVNVMEMIPPGFSPATYDPSPDQLRKLQDANIYFRIGHIPFEKAQMGKLEKLNPKMKVVDTSEGISLLEGGDPHIWLSPKQVKIQAGHIYDALVEYSPESKDYFTQNYNQFIKDLEKLDQKLKNSFAPIKGQKILVFHPAFGYLANAYGFQQEAIEVEGKDSTPSQLQKIIDKARNENIKVIFVQVQFSTESAEAIAQEIGGAVVQIDPLAKNYFTNLETMAETIVSALK